MWNAIMSAPFKPEQFIMRPGETREQMHRFG
jgi:hypothetical protein